jgi:ribosomal protein S27AE
VPEIRRTAVCPRCGTTYHGVPATSRVDNATPICPECGAREALASLGVDEKEIEQIITTIRAHSSRFDGREEKD